MESNVKKVVLEKLRSQSGLDIVREEDRLYEDLGISSLGMMMIFIDLEPILSITIDFCQLVNVKTAGQLIDAVASMGHNHDTLEREECSLSGGGVGDPF